MSGSTISAGGGARSRDPRKKFLNDAAVLHVLIGWLAVRPDTLFQRAAQLALPDHEAKRVAVQQIADGLHLRQNQAALRRLLVNRHDEHGEFARANEVADEGRAVNEIRRRDLDQRLAQLQHSRAAHGRRAHHASFFSGQPGQQRRVRLARVHLIEHHDNRRRAGVQFA